MAPVARGLAATQGRDVQVAFLVPKDERYCRRSPQAPRFKYRPPTSDQDNELAAHPAAVEVCLDFSSGKSASFDIDLKASHMTLNPDK